VPLDLPLEYCTGRKETAISDKVLVIEDDPSYLRYLGYLLGKEGYEVVSATNGMVGLRKAKEDLPALMILDVMLPGLDGFEVCHRLREDSATAGIPVIMLSAKGQDTDRTTGLRVGANVFFAKPVDREVLLNKIKELLAKPDSAAAT
jgi:two-component system, OmpR family, alkaline phosphatase synthesis response regulator PhoP